MSEPMNVTPLGDRVLIRVDDNDPKTASGLLHLPETVRHNVVRGVVVAVGPGRMLENGKRAPVPVKVGERIQFRKHKGSDIRAFVDHHLVLREDEIDAVVEP